MEIVISGRSLRVVSLQGMCGFPAYRELDGLCVLKAEGYGDSSYQTSSRLRGLRWVDTRHRGLVG